MKKAMMGLLVLALITALVCPVLAQREQGKYPKTGPIVNPERTKEKGEVTEEEEMTPTGPVVEPERMPKEPGEVTPPQKMSPTGPIVNPEREKTGK